MLNRLIISIGFLSGLLFSQTNVNGVQDGTDIGALGVECSSIDRPILNWTNSGFENGFIDWDYFPSDINEYADVVDEIAYEGSKSLKIIPYTGDGYYARVGKDYYETDAENLAGRTIHLEAQFFTSSDDLYWLGGDTLRFLAMYFDQGWMEIQADYSENFDLNVNNWNYKNLVTTVPSNAQNIIFGINATGDESVGSIYVDNFTATLIDPPMISSEIFFSEYSEGSGNNKYLEIYNGSSETINLDDYVILSNYNGNPWSETFTFVPGATLESRDVYVICFGGADESILEFADEVCPWLDPWRVAGFNGDDARALASAIDTNIIIDIIGTLDGDGDGIPGEGSEDDPGGGWEVAGVYEATKNHTMVRKASIYEGNGGNWASSAGTSENNSEWIVYEQDYWENLGWHSSFGSNLPVKDGLGYDIDWTNITNELSANWLSNLVDGAVSFEYAIGIFPVPSTEIVSWTSTGTDTFFTQTGLSLVEGATYYSHIRRVNSTSQPIDTVSSDGVTIDLTAPVIDAIYEGDISEDMDFQQSTDYLTLAWSGMDVTSGIDKYEYAWGTTAGADDIVAWFATNEQSAGDTVLSLQDGSMYFGSVRGTDAAGNQSNTLTGNGLTIDASQPIGGMVIDGDSIDLDFTSSTTTLTASWSGFTDEGSGISEYHYAIGTEPGETQNVNWVSVGTDSLVTNSTLTLISGITYYVSVRATDSVGNEGNTVYTNGITIDTQPPSTGNVNDGPEQDLEITSSTNTLSGNWTGFNDALSGIAFYEYAIDTISGGTDLVSWTNTGLDSNFTEDDLNLQNNQEYFISVRATDALGNVCEAVSSDGITVDWEFPTIAYLYEGNTDSDNDSQSDNQNLVLAWGLDNSAVTISSYEYSVGTEPGTIDILGWTDNDTDTMVTITGLSLEYGLTYYGSVRAYNADGFSSSIFSGDGITIVDMVPPVSGMVIDGSGEDIDYVNSNGNVEASWSGFIDEESGIESYEYALGSDASLIDIIDFTPIGLEQNILLTGLSLANGSHYQFSVRAIDMVGNVSDTATSDGFVVDSIMGPPQITNLSVDTLSFVNATTDTQIEIEFSEPLQNHNVELAASIQSGYTVASVYSEDPPKLNVTLQAPFASMDTLILIIDNLIDLAGVEADPKELTYYSGLLADYNSDLNVDIIDLAQFIQAWNNGDFTYELGPVTGAVPHLIPAPDSLFTIRDAMTFSRMWYWSNSSAMNTMAMRSAMGAPIEVNQYGRKILIKLPDESIASEIAIEYPIENMEFSYQSEINKENDIMLSKKFAEEQVFMQLNGFIKSSDISIGREIMFDISGSPDHEIELVINYRFMGSGSETIGEGSHQLNYLPMPDEFSLYQNYPNPFNPVTQIKYDLPEASHIQLFIYDILGREVTSLVNEVQEPGYKSITWNGTDTFGRNVGAGMYFYSIQAGDFRQVKKMVYLK